MSQFSTVYFIDTEEEEIIHQNWLTSGKSCYWPPYKNYEKVKKALLSGAMPEASWPEYQICIRQNYDSYEKAREELFRPEETSESDSEILHSEVEKRKSQVKRSNSCLSPCSSEEEKQKEKRQKPDSAPDIELLPSTSTSCFSTSAENVIIKMLCEMKKEIKSLHIKCDWLLTQSTEKDSQPRSAIDTSFLPLDSLEELNIWEEYISVDDNYQKMALALGCKGGAKVDQCTRRILADLLTNNCATSLNWAGRGSKEAFKEMRTSRFVIDAVRKNTKFAYASEKEIEDAIKSWLKYAPVRLQYNEKKDQL